MPSCNYKLLDNGLSKEEIKILYSHFLNKKYDVTHRSHDMRQTIHQAQLAYFLTDEDLNMNLVKKVFKEPVDVAYVQIYTPSTVPFMHKDHGYTSLTFIHPEYSVDWGGEFILYGDEDIGTAFQPIPGRTILFNGNRYNHVGRAFNHLSKYHRMILVGNYNNGQVAWN